jgi:transposase
MFTVELYAGIRRAVMVDGLSRREAAKRFGVHRNTITKMLQYSVPPGYRRRERPASKKLGPYMAWIDKVLEDDRSVHKKQRHTAHRIFERLRDEEGFSGGYTIVREYVARVLLRSREMFIPLSHRPGHAQADFGQADGYIAGKKVRFHYFCVDLPHSDGCFVKAYPAETAEAFCDGHVAAFDFFGGVPQSILYDNTRLAVAKIIKGGERLRSQMFAELQSHYLFEDRFGRPGKGNDKGKVEGLSFRPLHAIQRHQVGLAGPTLCAAFKAANHSRFSGTLCARDLDVRAGDRTHGTAPSPVSGRVGLIPLRTRRLQLGLSRHGG